MPPIGRLWMQGNIDLVAGCGLLKFRRKPEVYRIPMPDKGLHEVAEVVFLRARSYGRPRVQDLFLASPSLLFSLTPSRLALIIGTWFVLQGISKSSKFAGVGSAVEVGFEYRGMFCITRDFQKVMKLRVLAPPLRLALNMGAWFVLQGSLQVLNVRVSVPLSGLAL